AGLIPCPLTLFVMTFAISRGVPEAGVAFAVTMMIGVALVLSLVAVATVLFRQRVVHLIEGRPLLLDRITRGIEGSAGLLLTAIAMHELIWR
ncbi:MAG TPA: ABC transporter permease, partial [Xanthobacteraceae bacterium]|nr:ABC transporter permease [Xanthobacteraceae bacterium]